MIYGITGNTQKADVWDAAARVINLMAERSISYKIDACLKEGLSANSPLSSERLHQFISEDVTSGVDMVLSLGGDGTLLEVGHQVGEAGIPILGVNIGRLGFLADVDISDIEEMVLALESGNYSIEKRTVLKGLINGDASYASNEFVVSRSGTTKLISIETHVDGRFLNTYWADGLIVSTSTGSTAYSLSVGGPIIEPGSGVIVVSPIAPHTLTVRPIILPNDVQVTLMVTSDEEIFSVSVDGKAKEYLRNSGPLVIEKAHFDLHLIKLQGQEYFETLRKKLGWGR